MAQWNDQESQLRQHLVSLLTEPNAHATFDQAVENMPVSKRGVRPENSEHSAWELLEHLRIAQEDILDFSRNPDYKERKWPDAYWPESPTPPNDDAWDESVEAFRNNRSLRQNSRRLGANSIAGSAADRRPQRLPRRAAHPGSPTVGSMEIAAKPFLP
jgi:hypothetical protein